MSKSRGFSSTFRRASSSEYRYILLYRICSEMPEKKSEIFSLAFHYQACTTGFIRVQQNVGWLDLTDKSLWIAQPLRISIFFGIERKGFITHTSHH